MSFSNLGLGGKPARFLGAYVMNVNSSLGLAQSPSTCTVTLIEDKNSSPQVLFNDPTVGEFKVVEVGSKFKFAGIITGYTEDVKKAGGKTIQVNLSDPREIMKNIPIIIAPGYRQAASLVENTGCSVVDAFGAYDDFDGTGINLSGWNQAGMTYQRIAHAFKGGTVNVGSVLFNVPGQAATAFGQLYRFNLDEVTAKVDTGYRVSSNLISVADFIQEMASRHSFDWFVESEFASDGYIDVTIRIIDRSTDNIDIDLDDFISNLGDDIVPEVTRGYELRSEVACTVLLGALIESMIPLTIEGLANNPVDLSDEGGASKYYMTEEEMRYVLGSKESWKFWVANNGGLIRYSVGGSATIAPMLAPGDPLDIGNQIGLNPNRASVSTADEEVQGRIYEKLKGHAESTYGKRFMFPTIVDADTIDAAWTADTIAGNNDPNEYFRNDQGKTRCYVEFSPSEIISLGKSGAIGFAGNFAFGQGDSAPQALPMDLRNLFDGEQAIAELDKADWIFDGENLYVAATIEENNVVRIDAPIIQGSPSVLEGVDVVADLLPGQQNSAGGSYGKGSRTNVRLSYVGGASNYQPTHAKAYQPRRVFVPTKSKFNRYGPVIASNVDSDSQGKLVIDQDDGFAPWEFGSVTVMLDAMQFRVDNSSSNVKQVERATIQVVGFPTKTIGESLGQNSNINSINISMSNGVTTTYELRSFLREFGELSKEELAALSLFARRGGARILPQDLVGFINRYRSVISRQFGGRGSLSTSATNGGAGVFE